MTQASLKDLIKHDMIAAMRSKDSVTLGVIRMLQAAIKQKEIDGKITLGDAEILAVIEKMIKQRRDAASQFEQGNRPELAEKELHEASLLQKYLPKQLDDSELQVLIEKAVQEVNASSMQDMGKVMGILKPHVQGRADMSTVSAKIKALLS